MIGFPFASMIPPAYRPMIKDGINLFVAAASTMTTTGITKDKKLKISSNNIVTNSIN